MRLQGLRVQTNIGSALSLCVLTLAPPLPHHHHVELRLGTKAGLCLFICIVDAAVFNYPPVTRQSAHVFFQAILLCPRLVDEDEDVATLFGMGENSA